MLRDFFWQSRPALEIFLRSFLASVLFADHSLVFKVPWSTACVDSEIPARLTGRGQGAKELCRRACFARLAFGQSGRLRSGAGRRGQVRNSGGTGRGRPERAWPGFLKWPGFLNCGREFLSLRNPIPWATDKLQTCRHGRGRSRTSYKLAATGEGDHGQVTNLPPRGEGNTYRAEQE